MADDPTDRQVSWLCLGFALAPLLVGLAGRLGPPAADPVARSLDKASVLLEFPCLFAVLILLLTRATWAAWANLLIQGLLFAMLVAASLVMEHRFAPRDALGMALIALLAWRVLALARARARR